MKRTTFFLGLCIVLSSFAAATNDCILFDNFTDSTINISLWNISEETPGTFFINITDNTLAYNGSTQSLDNVTSQTTILSAYKTSLNFTLETRFAYLGPINVGDGSPYIMILSANSSPWNTPQSFEYYNHVALTNWWVNHGGGGESDTGVARPAAGTYNTLKAYYNITTNTKYYIDGSLVYTDTSLDALPDKFKLQEIINAATGFNGFKYDYVMIYEGEDSSVCYEAPPPAEGLFINITHPFEGEILNKDFFVNVTSNETITCSINNSNWSIHFSNNTLFSFLNDTLVSEGNHSIWINCTDAIGGDPRNATRNFLIDTIPPAIAAKPDLKNNNTIVWNGTLNTYINFTDNQEIYSINVTLSNGTVIFNDTNMGITYYQLNISQGIGSAVSSGTARTCDAHTGQIIKEIKNQVEQQGLKYVMKEWFFIDTEWVHVYPKYYGDYDKPQTTKLNDRYQFNFKKKIQPGTETFIVESSHYIDIAKSQNYPGHLIIPGIGSNGYWVDFENKEATKYEVKRISDYNVEVTVYGLKSSDILFSSIGELNCFNETFYFGNLNPSVGYTSQVIIGDTSTFYLNITEDPITMGAVNATLHYNNTAYFAGTTSNFSADVIAPSEISGRNENLTFYWVVGIDGESYNLSHYNQTVHNKIINNCTDLSTTTLIVSFKNSTDQQPSTVDVFLSVEGDVDYFNSFNDVNNFSLCIYPDIGNFQEAITIQYGWTDSYNYYNFDTYLNNQTQALTLYTQDSTQTTTLTVKDKDTNELLENVYGTMYRRIEGTWQPIESKYTDITGRVEFSYESDVKYKFFLSKSLYNPVIFYLDPVKFNSYDILMTKNTTLNTTQDYDRVALVYYPKLFYNNLTNSFTFIIQSPYGELEDYGYNLTYPSGGSNNTGSNGAGEELTSVFNISGAALGDRLKLDYYYETSISGRRNFTYYYDILISLDNNTMMGMQDKHYGLGIFERLLIVVCIVLVLVGFASLVGQSTPGMFIGIGIFIYFTYTGFIPLWPVLISIAMGLLMLGSNPEG